jgi:hypothetical protein
VKVRVRTQPLPVLTKAQVKLLGPSQPTGSVPKLFEIPKPEIALPSLDVKVMLTVRLAPTDADTAPPTEGVATTESMLPVRPPPPAIGSPGGPAGGLPLVDPVPLPELSTVPRLLLLELDPQPANTNSEHAPMTSERWPGSISFAR